MARSILTATVGSALTPSFGKAAEPNDVVAALAAAIAAAVALVPASTTVAANIATLVADGASPTQGHVNTLNTNWGTFLTALTTYNAAVAALSTVATAATVSADMTLLINATNVVTKNAMRGILKEFQRLVESTNMLSGT